MTTTDRGRTLPPTAEQIEHVRQCPARHAVFTGDKVNDLADRINPEDWVVAGDLYDRPTVHGGGEPSRAGDDETWHNPGHTFLVIDAFMLPSEGTKGAEGRNQPDPRVDVLAEAVCAHWSVVSERTRDELRPGYRDLLARLDAARPR